MSNWSKILALLACVEPSSLLQEEQVETLTAIISGTMKKAASTLR
jgi:hypothetical protein